VAPEAQREARVVVGDQLVAGQFVTI
jgi:hypothetical protein